MICDAFMFHQHIKNNLLLPILWVYCKYIVLKLFILIQSLLFPCKTFVSKSSTLFIRASLEWRVPCFFHHQFVPKHHSRKLDYFVFHAMLHWVALLPLSGIYNHSYHAKTMSSYIMRCTLHSALMSQAQHHPMASSIKWERKTKVWGHNRMQAN